MGLIGTVVALIVVAICGVGLYGSLEITSIPHLAIPYSPADFEQDYESLSFLSHDGLKLTGWFVPSKNPSPLTLVVLHGIGSNAGDMILNTVCLMKENRWNLFYINFRGHADSEGTRTSLGPLELKDFESAMTFIKNQKPEATRRLAVYGHSLGAAVAIVAAARHPELEAVAAEDPFSFISKTVRHFAHVFYGIPYFPFIPLALFFTSLRLRMRIGEFAPANVIGEIAPRPIFFIHAERDLRMPPSDIQALWEAAKPPKELWVAPGADHGESWLVDKAEYERRLVGFFKKVFV